MLQDIFNELDLWVAAQNREARRDGYRELPKCEFRVVGHVAVMEAELDFDVGETNDLDTLSNAKQVVLNELRRLLQVRGLSLETLDNQIWMPEETIYVNVVKGDYVTASRALPEYVMVSKAKFAPGKNRVMLRQYIAGRPPKVFFEMCAKYSVDLSAILDE